MIKTYKGWQENDKNNLGEYLQVGDIVDREMMYYFINVLPPRTMTNKLIQIGEPYSHRDDPKTGRFRATYSTLKNTPEGWKYCGYCFAGEDQNVE